MSALYPALHAFMIASRLFELGAIRLRARSCPHFAVADLLPENAFADLILCIGPDGRERDSY